MVSIASNGGLRLVEDGGLLWVALLMAVTSALYVAVLVLAFMNARALWRHICGWSEDRLDWDFEVLQGKMVRLFKALAALLSSQSGGLGQGDNAVASALENCAAAGGMRVQDFIAFDKAYAAERLMSATADRVKAHVTTSMCVPFLVATGLFTTRGDFAILTASIGCVIMLMGHLIKTAVELRYYVGRFANVDKFTTMYLYLFIEAVLKTGVDDVETGIANTVTAPYYLCSHNKYWALLGNSKAQRMSSVNTMDRIFAALDAVQKAAAQSCLQASVAVVLSMATFAFAYMDSSVAITFFALTLGVLVAAAVYYRESTLNMLAFREAQLTIQKRTFEEIHRKALIMQPAADFVAAAIAVFHDAIHDPNIQSMEAELRLLQ